MYLPQSAQCEFKINNSILSTQRNKSKLSTSLNNWNKSLLLLVIIMKNTIKFVLQKLLGYQKYLFLFARYKIKTLKNDRKEGDFFHFMNIISSEGAILDIGANLGIMTYHLSKKFSERKIFAIEPMPDNLFVLKKIISKYNLSNSTIIPFAVGKDNGTLEMILPINGMVKMQGLAHVIHESIDEWNDGKKISVKSIKLDDEFKNQKIAAIKMDIENFEFFALQGGKKIIQNNLPVIYLELWPNENRNKCFDLLNELGYIPNIVENDKIVKYDSNIHNKQNFIFTIKN